VLLARDLAKEGNFTKDMVKKKAQMKLRFKDH
jgi:hypothetical protein